MMKKYLMLGIAAVAMGAAFTSCNKNDFEATSLEQIKEAQYTKAFEQTFGQINPNVNWGFNAMSIPSIDKDGMVTRGVWTNANMWSDVLNVPAEPTEAEIDLVQKWFNANPNPKVGVSVNWSNFFVFQVWTQGYGDKNMDQIKCGVDNDNLEHINNFNLGGGTDNGWHGKSMFMKDSGTGKFTYECSLDDNKHTVYDRFVIIPGSVIDDDLAGFYYVGFDFESLGTTAEKVVKADGNYADYIIRINPANYKNAQRVMIEDLIANNLSQVDKSDWDFNDAVFDVAYTNENIENENKLVAHIMLYAAGGTKELTIGGKEVHQLFGVATNKMINTNANNGINNLVPVQFNVVLGNSDWGTHTADEVPVYVGATELKAEEGKAPQKIVTDTDTRWMKERQLITNGYAKFADYVNTGAPTNWYDEVTDASVLY